MGEHSFFRQRDEADRLTRLTPACADRAAVCFCDRMGRFTSGYLHTYSKKSVVKDMISLFPNMVFLARQVYLCSKFQQSGRYKKDIKALKVQRGGFKGI